MTLDETIFNEVGLSDLSAEEKARILKYVEQSLMDLVGMRIASLATPEQLEAIEAASKQSQDAAVDLLAKTFPQYETIVSEELEIIKSNLKDIASDVLAASDKK